MAAKCVSKPWHNAFYKSLAFFDEQHHTYFFAAPILTIIDRLLFGKLKNLLNGVSLYFGKINSFGQGAQIDG